MLLAWLTLAATPQAKDMLSHAMHCLYEMTKQESPPKRQQGQCNEQGQGQGRGHTKTGAQSGMTANDGGATAATVGRTPVEEHECNVEAAIGRSTGPAVDNSDDDAERSVLLRLRSRRAREIVAGKLICDADGMEIMENLILQPTRITFNT